MIAIGNRFRALNPALYRRFGSTKGNATHYLLDYADGTFTRASSAEAIDPRDDWAYYQSDPDQTLGTDEPRLYDDRTILIEGARTNLIRGSANLTGGFWALVGSASRVASATVAPDGSLDAIDLTFTASTSDGISNASNALNLSESGVMTIFAKATSAQTVRLEWLCSDGTTDTSDDINVTTEWTRIQYTPTNSATGASTQRWFLINGSDGAARTVTLWGGMMEGGGVLFPSTYVLTVSSNETRANEGFNFPNAMLLAVMNGRTKWTVWPEFSSDDVSPTALSYRIFAQNGGNQGLAIGAVAGGTRVRMFNPGGGTTIDRAITFDRIQPLTITCDFVNGEMIIEGATTGDGTYSGTGLAALTASAATLNIGTGASISTQPFFGVISRPVKL